MAKDTREIVYYKGKEYYLIRKDTITSDIQQVSASSVKMIVMTEKLLTREQYEESLKNQRSKHITW